MKIYLVGGAVRDKLLNYPFHERDWVVVGANEKEMLEQGFASVGKDFPVFLHPKSKEEYALARKERKISAGYTGFDFDTDASVSLEQDLSRRDLTINAIAEDEHGNLIDPYNGQADIRDKILRHVSPAFIEDPLRVLRVARFMARFSHLGFCIADDTQQLLQAIVTSGEIQHLVAERVWKECEKSLAEKNPECFFQSLDNCGALNILMPELSVHIQQEKNTGGYAALQQAAADKLDTDSRFACLLYQLDSTAIDILTAKLKCPKQTTDLAKLLSQSFTNISNALSLNHQQVWDLLQDLDALRRPERFITVLTCAKTCAQAESPNTRLTFNQATFLRYALHECSRINAKTLVAQGLKGPEVGEALTKLRLAALENLIAARQQSLPHKLQQQRN